MWEPRLLRGAALTAHRAFDEAVPCLRERSLVRLARQSGSTAFPAWPTRWRGKASMARLLPQRGRD